MNDGSATYILFKLRVSMGACKRGSCYGQCSRKSDPAEIAQGGNEEKKALLTKWQTASA